MSHTVNIKCLPLYSCGPVTQMRHVFHWEIRQFSVSTPVALTNSDGHRQITETQTFDYLWVFLKRTKIKLEPKQPPWSASTRHTLHPALPLLLTSYITPLTSRFSCYNPCVTRAHLLFHKPCKYTDFFFFFALKRCMQGTKTTVHIVPL